MYEYKKSKYFIKDGLHGIHLYFVHVKETKITSFSLSYFIIHFFKLFFMNNIYNNKM